MGLRDAFQKSQTIKRNFPLLGRFRYLLESIRPEIQQYFIENNSDGRPFSREERSLVYQRAKGVLDTLPFGTQKNVYEKGYEWVNHSLNAKHVSDANLRVMIGGKDCKKPYSASIFNISAMSFGALSSNAILALNGGAKDGNFAHNTGEGSISSYHAEPGGDLIWQIGTGYFGCRNDNGTFNDQLFKERAAPDNVKMIEIKLSQGAKPGHGGILPKEKISDEIAKIRNVPKDRDVVSPPTHKEFDTPKGLLEFIKRLRELSGGKPIGFKLCLGKRREFVSICKAMVETKIYPDFITVDGGEGGTGAAPLEFSNYIGTPGIDALIFIHNCLVGFDLRKEIKIISSGRASTGFDLIKRIALGSDAVNCARGMMLAIGCIQALRCNANICPAGVATQDKHLTAGLVVPDKRKRVAKFHKNTIKSVAEILGAMGMENLSELKPWHIFVREDTVKNRNYAQIFDYVKPGDFLNGNISAQYKNAVESATSEHF